MQIRKTIVNPSTASTESPPEDVIVLVDSAGVAPGVQHAFNAKVRAVRPGVSIGPRWLEIPLVGGNGQISGVLCQSMPPSDVRGASISSGSGEARAIDDVAQLVVHDINNLLAVIGSGLRLLEGQSDAAHRKAIVSKMQHAITRGALLSRQLSGKDRRVRRVVSCGRRRDCCAARASRQEFFEAAPQSAGMHVS